MNLKKRSAFTILELLIVIILIALLTALAIPQYQLFMEKAIAVEAVNILGATMKEVRFRASLTSAQDVVDQRIEWAPHETKYWYFFMGHNVGEAINLQAQRRDGPYKFYTIDLWWYYNTNMLEWTGSHPGTPGGPTQGPPAP